MKRLVDILIDILAILVVGVITILLTGSNYDGISWCGGAIAMAIIMFIKEVGE